MPTLLSVLKSSTINRDYAVVIDDDDLKRIQQELLVILDDMINVFNELDMDYQLSGGTALGGIRHQGFIPWDDDIDINLKRKDVEPFVSAFLQKYGDKYWIHVPGKTLGYDAMMIRVISKNVRARVLLDSEKVECGLMIDIFILENVYDNSIARKIQGIGSMVFRYILSCIRFKRTAKEMESIVEDGDELKKFMSKRCRLGKIFSIIPVNAWAKAANAWVSQCRNENSKYVAITSGTHQFFKEMYERESFCSLQNCMFEGRAVKISADYDSYLKKLYGNYMEIPPKGKREKHMMMELDRAALYHRNDLGGQIAE